MKQSELRQLIRKLITEDDSTESYLAPSRFTFEPNDKRKDLMIHKLVDEYQEEIFDYLWNYSGYKNSFNEGVLKEDLTSNPYKAWKEKSYTKSDAEIVSDMIASIDSEKFPQFIKDFENKLFIDTGTLSMERLDKLINNFFELGKIASEDRDDIMNIINIYL